VAVSLIEGMGWKYTIVGRNRPGMAQKMVNMVAIDVKLFNHVRRIRPDIFVSSGSPYVAQVSSIFGRPHISFGDTEHSRFDSILLDNFTDARLNPNFHKVRINPKKQVLYNGSHELAYLHPKYFKPDPSILDDLGLKVGEPYSVCRFISFDASHDLKSFGFSDQERIEIVKLLEKHGKVFVNCEDDLPSRIERYKARFPPKKFHSLLYYSQLFIGDAGTAAVEAAILGTPSIHMEAWRDDDGELRDVTVLHGLFDETVNKYKILYTYKSGKEAICRAREVLLHSDLRVRLKNRSERFLREKIDVTAFMVRFIEEYPNSHKAYLRGELYV